MVPIRSVMDSASFQFRFLATATCQTSWNDCARRRAKKHREMHGTTPRQISAQARRNAEVGVTRGRHRQRNRAAQRSMAPVDGSRRADTDRAAVVVDITNAFHSADRAAVLAAVPTHFPSHAPRAAVCLMAQSTLVVGMLISPTRGSCSRVNALSSFLFPGDPPKILAVARSVEMVFIGVHQIQFTGITIAARHLSSLPTHGIRRRTSSAL